MVTSSNTSLLSPRLRDGEVNQARWGGESGQLSSGGYCGGAQPPQGSQGWCARRGDPQLPGRFCVRSNPQICLPEPHWPGLASCGKSSSASHWPVATVSSRVDQKQLHHDVSKRGRDFAHYAFPWAPWGSDGIKPTAISTSKVGWVVSIHMCVWCLCVYV